MFVERILCMEFMERGYEIWKALTTVSTAHKPQHFLYAFKDTAKRQSLCSPLSPCTRLLSQRETSMKLRIKNGSFMAHPEQLDQVQKDGDG